MGRRASLAGLYQLRKCTRQENRPILSPCASRTHQEHDILPALQRRLDFGKVTRGYSRAACSLPGSRRRDSDRDPRRMIPASLPARPRRLPAAMPSRSASSGVMLRTVIPNLLALGASSPWFSSSSPRRAANSFERSAMVTVVSSFLPLRTNVKLGLRCPACVKQCPPPDRRHFSGLCHRRT